VRFHEGDVKEVCLQAGLGGRECEVRRTGRERGRRVEIRLSSPEMREEWFMRVQEKMRERGWHAVRGRPYEERVQKRKSKAPGQQRSVAEIALSNYYSLLEKIGDAEERECEGESGEPQAPERRERRGSPTGRERGRQRGKVRRGRGERIESKEGTRDRGEREGVCEEKREEAPRGSAIRVGTWNVQGIANKWLSLVGVVESHQIDILGVCEHWMKKGDTHKLGPNSRYMWFGKTDPESESEERKRGIGGVGFLVDSRVVDLVSIVQCPDSQYSSRHMWLKLRVNGNVSVFVGVVYMPVENVVQGVKQAVLDEVAEQYGKLKQLGDVFILGDLNARVGKCAAKEVSVIGPFGEETRNRSGEMWIQFAKREGLMFFNGRKRGGGVEFTRIGSDGRESVLDYIIGPENVWKGGDVKRLAVAQGVNDFIGSDHRLVYADLEVRARVRREGKRVRVETWRIRELREREREDREKVLEDFSGALKEELREWEEKMESGRFMENVESMYQSFRGGFDKACLRVVGKSVKFVRPSVKRLPSVFKSLLELRNVVRKEAETSSSKDLFKTAASMSEKIKSLISKRNRLQWEAFCAEIKSGEIGPREFYMLLKRAIGSQRGDAGGIRNSKGEIVNNGQEIREVWRDFFRELGNGESQGVFDEVFKAQVEGRIPILERESFSVFQEGLDGPISESEILEHLKGLRNFKAAGLDGIKNELLKLCAGEGGSSILSRLFNFIWEKERLPEELTRGRIITLFKGGDPFDCGDYRGITLLSVVYKLLSSILNSRLSAFCEREGKLAEEQGGFRPGRGCADQAFNLFSIVGDRLREGKPTLLCFIDIKKAYDRVWRDGLWARLADIGVKGKMWRIIRMMYSSTSSSVFAGGKDSDFFDFDLGVRQGDVSSPLLFSIFFNGLIDFLKEKGYGVQVRWKRVCGLWYADDIVLLAEDPAELREMMACVGQYCRQWRTEANARKSGVMVVGAAPDLLAPFVLCGEIVPIVSKYKYLGIVFNDQWDWSDHVQYVLSTVSKRVRALEWRLWKNRAVDVETKVIAWKTIFRPALEYGSEVWWPQDKQAELFERLQLKVCKWMLGCAATTPTDIVLGDLGVPSMRSRFVRARLGFAGAVQCMTEGRIASACREKVTTWNRMVSRVRSEFGLSEQYGELHSGGDEEERAQRVREWKALVKVTVTEKERELWWVGLIKGKRSEIYREIKEAPGFEEYLRSPEFRQGGLLRFKIRSGMLYLNDEVGRRSKREADRVCSLCESGEVEDIKHFLFVCPKLSHVRDVFCERLIRLCDVFSIPSLVDVWNNGDVSARLRIVLGSCFELYRKELPREASTGDVARELRLVSNHFLLSLWNVRKKLLYSDLAIPMASGANVPPCGSAS